MTKRFFIKTLTGRGWVNTAEGDLKECLSASLRLQLSRFSGKYVEIGHLNLFVYESAKEKLKGNS